MTGLILDYEEYNVYGVSEQTDEKLVTLYAEWKDVVRFTVILDVIATNGGYQLRLTVTTDDLASFSWCTNVQALDTSYIWIVVSNHFILTLRAFLLGYVQTKDMR